MSKSFCRTCLQQLFVDCLLVILLASNLFPVEMGYNLFVFVYEPIGIRFQLTRPHIVETQGIRVILCIFNAYSVFYVILSTLFLHHIYILCSITSHCINFHLLK